MKYWRHRVTEFTERNSFLFVGRYRQTERNLPHDYYFWPKAAISSGESPSPLRAGGSLSRWPILQINIPLRALCASVVKKNLVFVLQLPMGRVLLSNRYLPIG